MRHVYIITGVIDETVMRARADVVHVQTDIQTLMHKHKQSEPCLQDCYLWPQVTSDA